MLYKNCSSHRSILDDVVEVSVGHYGKDGAAKTKCQQNTTNMNSTTNTTTGDESDGIAEFHLQEETLWMLLWIFSLFLFLCLPFCINSHRRQLCWRRIKERRWIHDDGAEDDDWYTRAVQRQQEERRQRLEEQQRRFETTRTQQDEIREQYLKEMMKGYSMTLTKAEIHEMEILPGLGRSSSFSQRSMTGSVGRNKSNKGKTTTTTCTGVPDNASDSGCDTTVVDTMDTEMDVDIMEVPVDVDLEAQDIGLSPVASTVSDSSRKNSVTSPSALPPVKERRSDSESDDDDHNENTDVVMIDFNESNQKVYVPRPGQTYNDGAEANNATTRRLAASGCTICLCLFEANERITWSSNAECSHLFHSDCVLHWYLAVGRKAQKKRLRQDPDMTDEEVLANICNFPTLCPTCRQPFCMENKEGSAERNNESTQGSNSGVESVDPTGGAETEAGVNDTAGPAEVEVNQEDL